jgi:hypothetical protein
MALDDHRDQRGELMITGMQWQVIWSYNTSKSVEVNIPARKTVAQITLGQTSGGGLINSGIRAFRTRPNAGGPEVVTDFGDNWYDWPNTVHDNRLSSVTFALALGARQESTGVCNFYFFG